MDTDLEVEYLLKYCFRKTVEHDKVPSLPARGVIAFFSLFYQISPQRSLLVYFVVFFT